MHEADWYFDFISQYSYFALDRLDDLRGLADIRLRPVLFPALLNFHGQKGPAEIPSKRVWTYRFCVWYARRNGIPFKFPATHPFNPLPYLRMALAAKCHSIVIQKIFEFLWTTGIDPSDSKAIEQLAHSLEIDVSYLTDPEIKRTLKQETDAAIDAGVFGVPTLVIDGHLFWGVESIEFAKDYLLHPNLFDDEEMRRVTNLPIGAVRRGTMATGSE